MPWPTRLIALFIAGIVSFAPASQASSISLNERSAATYLRLDHKYLEELDAVITSSEKYVSRFVTRTVMQCPKIASSAPDNHQLEQFITEALYAVGIAAEQPAEAEERNFSASIRQLTWNNKHLASTIHGYAAGNVFQPPQPRLCNELSAWEASGYRSIPQSTIRLLHEGARTAASPSEEEVFASLTAYAHGRTKKLLRSDIALAARNEKAFLKFLLPAAQHLQEGLGLSRPRVDNRGNDSI